GSRNGVVLSKILGEEELLRLLDVLGCVLEEGLLRGFSAEAIDPAVRRGPIDRAIGLDRLAFGQAHGAGIVELALGRRGGRRVRWRRSWCGRGRGSGRRGGVLGSDRRRGEPKQQRCRRRGQDRGPDHGVSPCKAFGACPRRGVSIAWFWSNISTPYVT